MKKKEPTNQKRNSKLSNLSLYFLITKIMLLILLIIANRIPNFTDTLINKVMETVFSLPWIIISLILAIISRIKYRDDTSKILIIIDIITIVLVVIFYIICMIFLGVFVGTVFKVITSEEIWNLIGGCARVP